MNSSTASAPTILDSGIRPASLLSRHRPGTNQGGTLIIGILAVGTLALIAANSMRVSAARMASVSQASSWQKAYFLAESGVDIARNALRAAAEDPTVWSTQQFPKDDGTFAKWSPADATTFPKTCNITMPVVADDGSLVSTVQVTIDKPSGAGTINPSGTASGACFRVRAIGAAEVPGPVRISHDTVETNLRKVNWLNDWRASISTSTKAGGANAARMLEVVLRPVSPFVAPIVAKEKVEIKKGSGKIVDSWNSQDPDSSQRKYMTPDKDKWKGARDVGNVASNGINSKNKAVKDAVRIEKSVIWGDVYVGDANQVNIKPAPANLTDVIKGGDIIGNFYMKLEPVAPASTNPAWSSGTTVQTAKPDDYKTAPLYLTASSDPNAPAQYKFTDLHLHASDKIIIKPPTDAAGVVQTTSYVNIWVANSLKIHKGGRVMLGNGVVANIYVDKCIHLESASKVGGITYADFQLSGAGKFVADSSGKPKYTELQPTAAQAALTASASQLMIYGALAKKNRSHAKISAELLGNIYAPNHDFKIKFKDGTYKNIYGSLVGRKFKIEGTTSVHYDENMAGRGIATDYQIASVVEDWYNRSSK